MDDDRPKPDPGGGGGDDDGRDDKGNSGVPLDWLLAVAGAVVAIFAIASAIGIIVSETSKSSPGQAMCSTSCYGFAKLECPGNRLMGACIGFWTCGNTPDHKCGQDSKLHRPGSSEGCNVQNASALGPQRYDSARMDAANTSVDFRGATLRQRYPGMAVGMILPAPNAHSEYGVLREQWALEDLKVHHHHIHLHRH